MYLKRSIDIELEKWMKLTSRKPLMIRGARQIGKSSSVKNLGKKFEYFVEVNFDENPDYKMAFQNGKSPREIIEQLSVLCNTPIQEGKTLLFLDEIQTCIPAISSLRYFYEKLPNLHVIAAGSLLEFALEQIPSFGVGRVRSLFMFPLSFDEFLLAHQENALYGVLNSAKPHDEFPELYHQKLKSYLKKFLIVGGMPEAVSTYVSTRDLLEVQQVLDDIIISVQDDFTKYKTKVDPARIRSVFSQVVQQIGNKFTYTFPNSNLSNVQVKDALMLLQMAGLVYPVIHSASNGIPLGAEINPKKQKFLLFDTGIFQRILGLDIASLLIQDDFNIINKGNIAELHVGLELIKNSSCYEKTNLHYWQREAKNSQAEVDYVIQQQDKIIPIEVKAGTKGAMQSLFLFLKEKNTPLGIRLSLENFSSMHQVNIFPLYAVKNVLMD